MKRRVVVTGMGGVTALGNTWDEIQANLVSGANAVRYMPQWSDIVGLGCLLGAPVENFRCSAS